VRSVPAAGEKRAAVRWPTRCPQVSGGRREARSSPAAGEMPAGFRRPARSAQQSGGRRDARWFPTAGEKRIVVRQPARCPLVSGVRREVRNGPAAGELPGRQRFPQLWGLEEPVRVVPAAWRLLRRRDEVRLVPRVEWVRFLLDLNFSGTNLYPNGNKIQVRSRGSVGQTGPVASILKRTG
jgi:hypothetical protein